MLTLSLRLEQCLATLREGLGLFLKAVVVPLKAPEAQGHDLPLLALEDREQYFAVEVPQEPDLLRLTCSPPIL